MPLAPSRDVGCGTGNERKGHASGTRRLRAALGRGDPRRTRTPRRTQPGTDRRRSRRHRRCRRAAESLDEAPRRTARQRRHVPLPTRPRQGRTGHPHVRLAHGRTPAAARSRRLARHPPRLGARRERHVHGPPVGPDRRHLQPRHGPQRSRLGRRDARTTRRSRTYRSTSDWSRSSPSTASHSARSGPKWAARARTPNSSASSADPAIRQRFPHLARVATGDFESDKLLEDYFEFGLQRVLDGLERYIEAGR